MALRRALRDYPEVLALSCFKTSGRGTYPSSMNVNGRAGLGGQVLPFMKQISVCPVVLVLYVRTFLPASRCREMGLYMNRLFPTLGPSAVIPALSAASSRSLLARFYGFEPAGGTDPSRSIAILVPDGQLSVWDRLAG